MITISFEYDANDRVTRQAGPFAVVRYTYDSFGRRKTTTVDDEPAVTYDYDSLSRLTSVVRDTAAQSFTYDGLGRLTRSTWPNGVVSDRIYNDSHQVVEIKHQDAANAVLSRWVYDYDAGQNLVSQSRSDGRVLRRDSRVQQFGVANRLSKTGNEDWKYDQEGRLVSRSIDTKVTTYTWDFRNRLTSINDGAKIVKYRYDAFGRRVCKLVDGNLHCFVYDGLNILREIDDNAGMSYDYLVGPSIDSVFGRIDIVTGDMECFHRNALGSVIMVTNSSGVATTRYHYDPFGGSTATGASTNHLLFSGREYDPESGLYFLRSRYYDPSAGRFLSEDSLGLLGGDSNLYRYALNNPVSLADPAGRFVGGFISKNATSIAAGGYGARGAYNQRGSAAAAAAEFVAGFINFPTAFRPSDAMELADILEKDLAPALCYQRKMLDKLNKLRALNGEKVEPFDPYRGLIWLLRAVVRVR